MGVRDFLSFLRPLAHTLNLTKFRGKRVGVDASVWLHMGMIADAVNAHEGKESEHYLYFFCKMIKICFECGVEPVIVFDGPPNPVKSAEDSSRQARRDEAASKARALVASKSFDKKEYQNLCARASAITDHMVQEAITVSKAVGLEVYQSPVEADSQLSHLCRMDYVDVILSTDSDLLLYGTPSVLFKMKENGEGEHQGLCPLDDLMAYRGLNPLSVPDMLHGLEDLDLRQFTEMAALAGCDYTMQYHIKRMGIYTAFSMIKEHGSLKGIFKFMAGSSKWRKNFPKGMTANELLKVYNKGAREYAIQMVFDPITKLAVPVECSFATAPRRLTKSEQENYGVKSEKWVKTCLGELSVKTGEPIRIKLSDGIMKQVEALKKMRKDLPFIQREVFFDVKNIVKKYFEKKPEDPSRNFPSLDKGDEKDDDAGGNSDDSGQSAGGRGNDDDDSDDQDNGGDSDGSDVNQKSLQNFMSRKRSLKSAHSGCVRTKADTSFDDVMDEDSEHGSEESPDIKISILHADGKNKTAMHAKIHKKPKSERSAGSAECQTSTGCQSRQTPKSVSSGRRY